MPKLRIVGIVGKINSGKGTAADLLVKSRGYSLFCMADSLKVLLRDFFQVPPEELWGPSTSRTNPKVRTLMQVVGTEAGRAYQEDFWVKKMEERIANYVKYGADSLALLPAFEGDYDDRKIVIADMRFQNEVDMVHNLGGKVLKIERPDNYDHVGTTGEQQAHISESGIDALTYDAIISNTGTVSDLKRRVLQTVDTTMFSEDPDGE